MDIASEKFFIVVENRVVKGVVSWPRNIKPASFPLFSWTTRFTDKNCYNYLSFLVKFVPFSYLFFSLPNLILSSFNCTSIDFPQFIFFIQLSFNRQHEGSFLQSSVYPLLTLTGILTSKSTEGCFLVSSVK